MLPNSRWGQVSAMARAASRLSARMKKKPPRTSFASMNGPSEPGAAAPPQDEAGPVGQLLASGHMGRVVFAPPDVAGDDGLHLGRRDAGEGFGIVAENEGVLVHGFLELLGWK